MPPVPIETLAKAPAEASPRRRGRLISRFRRSQDGATAVEFAFIAFPFLFVLAAIFETALMFWTSQVLDEAVSRTSRQLLTGEANNRFTGNPAANTAAFRNEICAEARILVDCSKVTIDVRSFSSFGDAKSGVDASNPISAGGLNTTGFGFNQPQAEQIVVVRAVLEYRLIFTLWSESLVNIGSGRRGIVATTAFRTEPFGT
ncbi:hypothetical protein ASE63_19315 [Bosea sp. Root381]|uniref:TadE/TadG family type IV pilus assembly protein n=1 Tax=Bosea sp. Root381 TaxID=1736524 RepID=UPI0006F6E45B|nr:TadE/TadG family type IV pilus assembly protein [Bosea sp. Root381]KRE11897.1 hypothetical protein ASE63_19315 [Bosea sp. Root381]